MSDLHWFAKCSKENLLITIGKEHIIAQISDCIQAVVFVKSVKEYLTGLPLEKKIIYH